MLLSNIVRGGQLTIHAIRMFKEVLYILICWFVFVFVSLLSFEIYNTTTSDEWNATYDYYAGVALDAAALGHKPLATRYFGRRTQLRARDIATSPFYISKKDATIQKIKEGAVFSGSFAFVLSILIGVYFVRKGIAKTGDTFKRGARPTDFESVRWAIKNFNRKAPYEAYTIAGCQYPVRGEMQHTMLIGTTGTGKTCVISDVVEQIRRRGDRAIIYDTKGCYVEWFHRQKDHILNPFDARSEKWNLLKEIEQPGHIKSIAQAFIPEGRGSSIIWNEAARIVFSAVVEKLMSDDISNREIADMILMQDAKDFVQFLKGTYAQSIIDTKAPETMGGVLFTLSSYLNSLKLCDNKRLPSFSIKEWIKESSDSFLFITSHQPCISELIPIQTVWWEIAFKNLLSVERNPPKKTWIILDEVGSLQGIPSLSDTMSKTREYGCCFVLGMQDIGQLEDRYGDRLARTISTLCNTRCVFRTPDPHTAQWISKNIGDQEIEQVKEGLSYGAHQMRDGVNVNKHNVVKPLVLPSEIQHLKDLELYLQLPNCPFVKTKIEWKERQSHTKSFIEHSKVVANDELEKDMKASEIPKQQENAKAPKSIKTVEEKGADASKQKGSNVLESFVEVNKFKL